MSAPPEETRADIARRRLAQLVASFDARVSPESAPSPEAPRGVEPERPRRRFEVAHVKVLGVVAVAGSVLLVWWLLSGRPHTTDAAAPLAFPTTTPASSAASHPAELVIDVVGKVRTPGIVTVPPGSRVYQAIEAAGGLKGKVDTRALNLARKLTDGEQLLVGIEPVIVPGTSGSSPSGANAKVNLNTATTEQLDGLPGVGPVTARAILDWRQKNGRFGTVDELLEVKGIGEATLDALRDLVTV